MGESVNMHLDVTCQIMDTSNPQRFSPTSYSHTTHGLICLIWLFSKTTGGRTGYVSYHCHLYFSIKCFVSMSTEQHNSALYNCWVTAAAPRQHRQNQRWFSGSLNQTTKSFPSQMHHRHIYDDLRWSTMLNNDIYLLTVTFKAQEHHCTSLLTLHQSGDDDP